ncbi:MAG: sulfatase-like hydrolase/transferase, partial [Elusimicrobiota bacterium]
MKPNIFLVTIDALRSDYIYRKHGNLHPFLSSLMKESLVFENAISPGPATAPAFPGLFTDMTHLEARKGKGKFNEIPSRATFLAERFRENGYFTAGFSNNAHLTRIQGYDKGFDHFYDGLGDEGSDEKSNKSLNLKNKIIDILENSFEFKFRRGKHVIGPLLSLINERGYERFPSMLKKIQSFLDDYSKDKPLFLWAHIMEVHSPYDLPSR